MEFRSWHKLGFLAALGVCTAAYSPNGRCLEPGTQPQESQEARSQAFQTAVKNYESGKFVEAEQILLPLLKRSPQAFDVNELMGLVLAGERRDADALAYLKNAVHAHSARRRIL